jgi:hypothetical protein
MAPDDSRCGTIGCPSDTACSDYATTLTTNRCAERGACKTSSDCPFVPATSGTYCAGTSTPLFCDGTGSCDQPATVSCGGDSACPVAPGLCCYNVSGTTPATSCQTSATGCTASPIQCDAIQIQCDDSRDCPGGEVCCYACGPGFSSATVSCVATAACDPNADQSFHVDRLRYEFRVSLGANLPGSEQLVGRTAAAKLQDLRLLIRPVHGSETFLSREGAGRAVACSRHFYAVALFVSSRSSRKRCQRRLLASRCSPR